jgi:hypothetical protein
VYPHKRFWRLLCLSPLAGTVLGGCLARVTSELDILLSPAAYSNALALPQSAVAPLIEFLLKAFRG